MHSGGTALTWLGAMIPDVIVLNLHLLDMPGAEVLRDIRANPCAPGVPVIVTTTHPQMAESAVEGADVVLVKPVPEDMLRSKVAELLGGRERAV